MLSTILVIVACAHLLVWLFARIFCRSSIRVHYMPSVIFTRCMLSEVCVSEYSCHRIVRVWVASRPFGPSETRLSEPPIRRSASRATGASLRSTLSPRIPRRPWRPARPCSSRPARSSGAKDCTPEPAKVNTHWSVPLKIPVSIHKTSDNPLEDATERLTVH